MFFTTKAEYGVRLLVALGRHAGGEPVSLKSVAEAEGLPMGYLEHIAASLRRAELIESTRGAHGGYALARDPAEISMDEALLALEGIVAPMDCFVTESDEEGRTLHRVMCSHEDDRGRTCATKLLWMRVQGDVMRALSRTTLAELVSFSEHGAAASLSEHGSAAPPSEHGAPAGVPRPPMPVGAGEQREHAAA